MRILPIVNKNKPHVDVLIIGSARSGTTLIASLVSALGVHQIGGQSSVQEDPHINEQLRKRNNRNFRDTINKSLHRAPRGKKAGLKLTVRGNRNSFFRFIRRNISYSVLILPYKNPLGTGLRRQYLHGLSLESNTVNVLRDQIKMAEFSQRNRNTVMVDVEQITSNPELALISFAELIGTPLPNDGTQQLIEKVFISARNEYLLDSGGDERFFRLLKSSGVYRV